MELEETMTEIIETDSENYLNNGGYILGVALLEMIQNLTDAPEEYGLDFDIEYVDIA